MLQDKNYQKKNREKIGPVKHPNLWGLIVLGLADVLIIVGATFVWLGRVFDGKGFKYANSILMIRRMKHLEYLLMLEPLMSSRHVDANFHIAMNIKCPN